MLEHARRNQMMKAIMSLLKRPPVGCGHLCFCINWDYLRLYLCELTNHKCVWFKSLLLGASVCVLLKVYHTSPHLHNSSHTASKQPFSPPPLAVNSLHSQDLRATRNESARHKCVMFPLLSFLQRSPVPFKCVCVCVRASNSCLLFLKCC